MLKTLSGTQERSSHPSPACGKTVADPARVLDRQVISGEVAAGSVLARGFRSILCLSRFERRRVLFRQRR